MFQTLKSQGSTPHFTQLADIPGKQPLFYSRREQCLITDTAIEAGYGYVPAGTLLAINKATGVAIPYAATGKAEYKAEAVGNVANGATKVQVLQDASYLFKKGDHIVLERGDNNATHKGGAITDIARPIDSAYATITFTAATGDNGFTLAHQTRVFVQGDASADSKAFCITDRDVDTGFGKNAQGANVSIAVKNAMLYIHSLWNMDDEALTALNARAFGRFLVI
jgi:hypothetical protein